MKVLLLKDVYKLGRAGDIKKVADGYGRNYLIPQGLATLATPGAAKQAEHIRSRAAEQRTLLNQELGGVAEQISRLVLTFPAKAGETGKLYGSITPQMIADAIQEKSGYKIDRHQLDAQPLRTLGEHKVRARLTLDLIPEMTVIVYREGEAAELPAEEPAEAIAEPTAETEIETETESAPESEEAEA
jgi:large subunit ribosomal protein L9